MDPHLKEAFPLPPMVAYRRPPNLKEKLVRAKVPPSYSRPRRQPPGMKKCRYDCLTCPYVQPNNTFKATASRYAHDIQGSVDCHTQNVVYCLSCNRCPKQFIGETEKSLAQRFEQCDRCQEQYIGETEKSLAQQFGHCDR